MYKHQLSGPCGKHIVPRRFLRLLVAGQKLVILLDHFAHEQALGYVLDQANEKGQHEQTQNESDHQGNHTYPLIVSHVHCSGNSSNGGKQHMRTNAHELCKKFGTRLADSFP